MSWDDLAYWWSKHADQIQTFIGQRRYVLMLVTGLLLVWALRKAKARGAL